MIHSPEDRWAQACVLTIQVYRRVQQGEELALLLTSEFARLLGAVDAAQSELAQVKRREGSGARG